MPMNDDNLDPLDFGIDATEARQSPRHAAQLVFAAMTVRGSEFESDCDQAFGVVLDICNGGIRMATPQPPPPEARIDVRIALEEDIFAVTATVRWVTEVRRSTYEVGIEFDPADPRKLDLLESFLRRVRGRREEQQQDS